MIINEKLVLVTDHVHPHLIEGLSKYYQVVYKPEISYAEVCQQIEKYNGLIINSKIKVDRDFLKLGVKLDWAGRLGSGLDVVDLEAAAEADVHVINSPEGNANAVGEHALGMLLSLLNKIPNGDEMVRKLTPWDRESMRGRELDGLTVGIVGCGHTGSAFIKKLSGFDVNILIYDKYRKQIPQLHRFQNEVELTELLQKADIISFHLPLTKETGNWINSSFMDKMKEGSIIINTSRGKIVNLADLVEQLTQGHIIGACLDVFENEKPSQYTESQREVMKHLVDYDQVIMTPHVAGWTIESKRKIAEILLKKIIYVANLA